MEECCFNCRYVFDLDEGGDPEYQSMFCRRYPANVLDTSVEDDEYFFYPRTEKDRWCGEWRAVK